MLHKNLPNWKGVAAVITAVALNLLIVTDVTGMAYSKVSMMLAQMDYASSSITTASND